MLVGVSRAFVGHRRVITRKGSGPEEILDTNRFYSLRQMIGGVEELIHYWHFFVLNAIYFLSFQNEDFPNT